uniref:Uncharacterized protein n=1 Tax=Arundo donax TaxID=35708 RepID=A0A0A9GGX0_ARUDO
MCFSFRRCRWRSGRRGTAARSSEPGWTPPPAAARSGTPSCS